MSNMPEGYEYVACAGACSMSRNTHVHFPDGFAAYKAKIAAEFAAASRKRQPKPKPPPDPTVTLTDAWSTTFDAVWKALKEADASDDTARLKAADIAAAIVGLRLSRE